MATNTPRMPASSYTTTWDSSKSSLPSHLPSEPVEVSCHLAGYQECL